MTGFVGPGYEGIVRRGWQYGMRRRSSIQVALDEGSGAFGGGVGEDLIGWALFLDAAGVEEDRAG